MTFTKDPGRFAGLLYILTSIVGFFAMGYVPSRLIVHGDATATAARIAAHSLLYRLGITGELIGQAGFIFVALALYDLFKGVNRRQASLMVILILVSIPIALVNELNALAALILVRGGEFLSVLGTPQREAVALLFVNMHSHGFGLAELFWGLWLFPLALLVYRSRFLPRFLGVWLALAGVAWVVVSLVSIVSPQYQPTVRAASQPAVLGEIVFMVWLAIRGAKPGAAPSDSSLVGPAGQ